MWNRSRAARPWILFAMGMLVASLAVTLHAGARYAEIGAELAWITAHAAAPAIPEDPAIERWVRTNSDHAIVPAGVRLENSRGSGDGSTHPLVLPSRFKPLFVRSLGIVRSTCANIRLPVRSPTRARALFMVFLN